MALPFNEFIKKTFKDNREGIDGYKLYQGFTFKYPEEIISLVPEHFQLVEEWCYGTFRLVWMSEKNLSILTYCEGDLILEVFENVKNFEMELKSTGEFYKEH
jgi:hypothetical protein